MANKYIGDLTAATSLASSDEFVVNLANDAGTKKITFSNLITQILGNILANNGTTSTAGTKALDAAYGKTLADGKENAPTELTATLAVGSTSLTFSNAAITTTSKFDFYTDAYGISPSSATVTTGQLVLTFPEQESALSVLVLVR